MSQKGNLIALAVLAALVGSYFVLRRDTSTVQRDLSPGFQAFRKADLSEVDRIVIRKGKEKEPSTLELRRKGDGWALPTAWDYPADRKKVEELVEELKKVKDGTRAGSQRSSHASFKLDEEKGVVVALHDRKDQKLAQIVLGSDAQGKTLSSGSFVRFDDEDVVWEVEASLRNKVISYPDKVEPKTFLEKVLWKLPEDHEAVRVSLIRPDHNVLVEKRVVDVPIEKKDGEKKDQAAPSPEAEKDAGSGSIAEAGEKDKDQKPETRKEDEFRVTAGTASFKVDKAKEWDARNLLTRDLRVDDAAEKKDPKEYGLDQPHLKVEIVHRKKDQKDAPEETTTIAFGNAIKEDKEGAEKGENKAYYAMLAGEAGGGRIYTVTKWDYNTWNKEVKDFEKPPEPPAPPPPGTPEGAGAKKDTPPATPAPEASAAPPPPVPSGPEKVTASHILFMYQGSSRAPATVTRTKEEAKKEAEAALAEVKKDLSKFGALAKEKSDCPSRDTQGDLGEFGRGVMAKPFEEAAFGLKPGEVSAVVETEFGFHVIQRTN